MRIKKTKDGYQLTGTKSEIDKFSFIYSTTHPTTPPWNILNPKRWRL